MKQKQLIIREREVQAQKTAQKLVPSDVMSRSNAKQKIVKIWTVVLGVAGGTHLLYKTMSGSQMSSDGT